MYSYYFLLVKDLSQQLILGTLFLSMIMSIEKIDSSGIYTIIQNQQIVFTFITQPANKIINELKKVLLLKKNK